jgi:hypothetical protein
VRAGENVQPPDELTAHPSQDNGLRVTPEVQVVGKGRIVIVNPKHKLRIPATGRVHSLDQPGHVMRSATGRDNEN